ncbi:MAG: Ribosomal protein L11 methyltransferase [Firmicutes bacterium ADurb.Bin300]|nr:MAG: Ribosomal protein L11 methyltransferase [Firmicutes bacterium ADurb.Bin300]
MDWTEIKISIPVSYVDTASSVALMTVPYGIYIEDYSSLERETLEIAHTDLIDDKLLKSDREHAIIHIYISPEDNPNEAVAFVSERLTSLLIPFSIGSTLCRQEDWANNWKKYYKPIFVGDRLVICPARHKLKDAKGRKVLLMEPGAAFGSGTHETTHLCLEALDKTMKSGKTVLDIGCGSGILSIAGLLLGAREAMAVDIDALAVKTAKENGKLNGFSPPKYTVLRGNLAGNVIKKYDVIVANIVADVIISFCDTAFSLTEKGGVFIASGIIDSRLPEVEEAIKKAGFTVNEHRFRNGWVCLVSKKI